MILAFDTLLITLKSEQPELNYQIDGRSLVYLRINDELYSSDRDDSIVLQIKDIVTYGHKVKEIHTGMGCSILVSAKAEINTESGFLYKL